MGRSRSRSRSAPRGGAENIWYVYMAPQGHKYYFNQRTNQTQWEQPMGPNDRIIDPAAPASMPSMAPEATWMRCADTYGRNYYHNSATGQTVWDRPSGPNDRIVDHPALAQLAMTGYGQPGYPNMYGAAPAYGAFGGAASGGDVEAFIVKNNLDASAGAKLRGLPAHVQKLVLDRGDLSDARNPNAVLMGRIRAAEQDAAAGAGGGVSAAPIPTGPPSTNVDQFIADNRLDVSAGDKLRSLPPDIQRAVMERGNLTDARNPNAMLMGRIRDAQNGK
eukprot:TRINITY_DN3478_c0_g1_i1.p1 TRINITY_DN3478_c0_g1~~TRINITY_DN3478_c0_g1_i1.p1  ORF type:complete len:276 (-),score=49.89 TRINITY_DN3478_c0_g1_i1:120-947(-)